jgi:hypothetical protein
MLRWENTSSQQAFPRRRSGDDYKELSDAQTVDAVSLSRATILACNGYQRRRRK